jgi:HNH endonuclease
MQGAEVDAGQGALAFGVAAFPVRDEGAQPAAEGEAAAQGDGASVRAVWRSGEAVQEMYQVPESGSAGYEPLARETEGGRMMFPKTPPVRLKGKALEALRRACFERDQYRCSECDKFVTWDGYYVEKGHMAHIVSRGRGGSDELSNVSTLCLKCHLVDEHAYGPSRTKPVPPKEAA